MNNLTKYDAAKQALQIAATVDEVKDIMDKSAAMAAYAKQANDRQLMEWAAEINLRAQRKAGELLLDMEKAKPSGNNQHKKEERYKESTDPKTLADLGITKNQSSTWQAVAKIKPDKFEKCLAVGKQEVLKAAAEIKKIQRKQRSEEIANHRQSIADKAIDIKKIDRFEIYHGDIKTFKNDKKYDYIITDPPYLREFLPLYEILASRASEFMADGALLICMCGQSYLDEIYKILSEKLDYYWTAAYLTPGQITPLRTRNINTNWKPLLIFTKKTDVYKGKIFGDVFTSDKNEKEHHKWGQSLSGMASIIKGICLPGQSIFDPFCGSGTTGIAALNHGCFFDGLEIKESNVKISRVRLNDCTK